MEGKSDKQLVWEALKAIEAGTLPMTQNFAILPETLWQK